jgi:hypothetical protein
MGCIISIIGVLVSVTCPAPVATPTEAARILAPRAFVAPAPVERRGPVVIVERPAPRPALPQARESEQGRANRMGIPGGWTPLEWAILHSGGK